MAVPASKLDADACPGAALFHAVDKAESAAIRQGIKFWQGLCGKRRFPHREQVTLRGLGRLAKHAVLVRVIDNGADYEFRFVGSEPVAAVGWNFQGRRMGEADVLAVMRANYRRQLYDEVVRTGTPWVFKCRLVEHVGLNLPVSSETVFLPLGPRDDTVDHLLGFTVFASRDKV